jgi:hypothetical protein
MPTTRRIRRTHTAKWMIWTSWKKCDSSLSVLGKDGLQLFTVGESEVSCVFEGGSTILLAARRMVLACLLVRFPHGQQ